MEINSAVRLLGSFEQTLRDRETEEKINRKLGDKLKTYPTGPMGLIPDEVKISAIYRKDKAAFDASFARLRKLNSLLNGVYKKEYRLWRANRGKK